MASVDPLKKAFPHHFSCVIVVFFVKRRDVLLYCIPSGNTYSLLSEMLHIISQGSLPELEFGFRVRVRVMVFNATFNNISVILVEETGVSSENHRPVASHWQTLLHIVVSS